MATRDVGRVADGRQVDARVPIEQQVTKARQRRRARRERIAQLPADVRVLGWLRRPLHAVDLDHQRLRGREIEAAVDRK